MRIVVLAERYAPDLDGADRRIADWANWLARRGHAVQLLVFEVLAEAPADITIRRVDASGTPRERAERIEAAGRALGADLLHDLGAGLGGDLFQSLQCALPGGRTKLHREGWTGRLRTSISPALRRREAERASLLSVRLSRCRLAIAESARVADELARAGAAGKVRILRPGVALRHFRQADPAERTAARARHGWTDRSLVILAVAPDAGLWNIANAALAVAMVRRRGIDAHLALAARASHRGLHRTLIACLARMRAVSDLGECTDLGPAYAAADVFLQPGFGGADDGCLEAMAAGLPVLVGRANDVADLITDGVQGSVLEASTILPLEVAWRVRGLDPAGLRQAMGAQARVLAQHHDIEATFRRLELICLELARSHPAAAERRDVGAVRPGG